MKHENFFTNLAVFVFIALLTWFIFSKFSYKEGLTTQSSGDNSTIAGGASAYGAVIKAANIGLQDSFLIGKYKTDYETVILNIDDLVDNLMLQTVLTLDKKDPFAGLEKLVNLNQSKVALDRVMKYVDSVQATP